MDLEIVSRAIGSGRLMGELGATSFIVMSRDSDTMQPIASLVLKLQREELYGFSNSYCLA